MKQTAVEWLVDKLMKAEFINNPNELIEQAKEMEKQQKNNLPIHIHEGIKNTRVYIEDGVVHIKPNTKKI